MPELPEVETIRHDLDAALRGRRVSGCDVFDQRLLSKKRQASFADSLRGKCWTAIERQGKYLVVQLEDRSRLVFHLRMTGQLLINVTSFDNRSPRMTLTFDNGCTLSFYDQRRFGEVWWIAPGQSHRSLEALGPDPLTQLSADQFLRLVKSKTTRIQPLLMDQHLIAGVGNIYAQEALFRAGVRPTRSSCRISREESQRLFDALKATLQEAIQHRGSTSRNYRDPYGQSGTAQLTHAVYRRGGEPCPRCQQSLRPARVGGRGTVYCAVCQR